MIYHNYTYHICLNCGSAGTEIFLEAFNSNVDKKEKYSVEDDPYMCPECFKGMRPASRFFNNTYAFIKYYGKVHSLESIFSGYEGYDEQQRLEWEKQQEESILRDEDQGEQEDE